MKLRPCLQTFLLLLTVILLGGISVLGFTIFAQTTKPSPILVAASPAQIAKPIITVSDRPETYSLGTYLEFLEDPDRNLTISEVSSPAFSRKFVHSNWQTPTFGYTTSAYWGKLSLANPTDRDLDWILSLKHQLIDSIDLYLPDPQLPQTWTVKK